MSLFSGFPDGLICGLHDAGLGTTTQVFYSSMRDDDGGWWGYGTDSITYENLTAYGTNYLIYDSSGVFQLFQPSGTTDYSDCQDKDISTTVSEGKSFEFSSSASSSASSSTSSVLSMPAFDLWMIYWSFFAMVCFVVWLGRSRKT